MGMLQSEEDLRMPTLRTDLAEIVQDRVSDFAHQWVSTPTLGLYKSEELAKLIYNKRNRRPFPSALCSDSRKVAGNMIRDDLRQTLDLDCQPSEERGQRALSIRYRCWSETAFSNL